MNMSAPDMVSPRFKARTATVFYWMTVLVGAALLTIVRVGQAPSLRLAFVADLLVIAWYVAVAAFFYDLLEPVNRNFSLLAAFFSLVGCAIQGFACLFDFAPLVVLRGEQYWSVFK